MPDAIVVLSPGDEGVAVMVDALRDKIWRRTSQAVTPISVANLVQNAQRPFEQWQGFLRHLAGGRLYLVGHGDPRRLGDFTPEQVAELLCCAALPATVGHVHVRACHSGAIPEDGDEGDLSPAALLMRALIQGWRAQGWKNEWRRLQVTGLSGRGVQNEGRFRSLMDHPCLELVDALRGDDVVDDADAIAALLQHGDYTPHLLLGETQFKQLFSPQAPIPSAVFAHQALTGLLNNVLRRLRAGEAMTWPNMDTRANVLMAFLKHQLSLDIHNPDAEDGDLEEDVLSTLDNLAPILHEALSLDRQTSKVRYRGADVFPPGD